jgi:hypothetical protein
MWNETTNVNSQTKINQKTQTRKRGTDITYITNIL